MVNSLGQLRYSGQLILSVQPIVLYIFQRVQEFCLRLEIIFPLTFKTPGEHSLL